eukprot:NODE_177_length_14091_cov_0.996141.p1 type:complete len:741 gc:universal NODE_177_length_14091_cov_0.996141:2257-4479(+)
MKLETFYDRSKHVLTHFNQIATISYFITYVENKMSNTPGPIPHTSEKLEAPGPLYIFASPIHLITGKPDPVSVLWSLVRTGDALCILLNFLLPSDRQIDTKSFEKSLKIQNQSHCKSQLYYALLSSKNYLYLSDKELFTITDVYREELEGYNKIIDYLEVILNRLIEKKVIKLENVELKPKIRLDGNLKKIFNEIIQTEKKYVKDIEKLWHYSQYVAQHALIKSQAHKHLFSNLEVLCEFVRQFGICIECLIDQDTHSMRIGALFIQLEESFGCYDTFCSNFNNALEVVNVEKSLLSGANHLIECNYDLQSYLIKPIQRICKYPLLLFEIIKICKLESEDPILIELNSGLKSIKKAANRVNETRRRLENSMKKEELSNRVENFKDEDYGELQIQDHFLVIVNEAEKALSVYLFDKIILCLKEEGSLFKFNKSQKSQLTIKGKIWMTNVTGYKDISFRDDLMLKVFWKTDEIIESFTLKCRNVEQLNLWMTRIGACYNKMKERARKTSTISKSQIQNDFTTPVTPKTDKPPRPLPPKLRMTEINTKSYLEDIAEDSNGDLPGNGRKSSLKFASQMPNPVPQYMAPPPYHHNHVIANEGILKEEKKMSLKPAPPRPAPPNLSLHLSQTVSPSDIPETPKIQMTYEQPRKAPEPPKSKKSPINVKIHLGNEIYALSIAERKISYADLYTRIQTKTLVPGMFKIKYFQNDGRSIIIMNDMDVYNAIIFGENRDDKTLNLFIMTN